MRRKPRRRLGGRRWIARASVSLGAACIVWLVSSPAATAAPPAGFQETVAFSGLSNPTAVKFSPDGRVFVAEKSGLIKVFDGLGDSTPTIFADLRTETYNFWDRGLLGLALDPQFPADPYVYALYTRDAMPGGNSPRWGTAGVDGDPCPNPPGATADGCVVTGRLVRLTASGDVATAAVPLITDWCQQFPSHSIGDLAFGADGNLYVSGGEGASFQFTDYGQTGNPLNPCGDPPGGVGATLTPPTAEGGSLRAQDVRTTGDPTGLSGSILRVDPDTGAAVSGNPYFGTGDANQQRIIAFGQRNPFRFTIRPGTNEVWTGDVGAGVWEEIDRVANPGGSAENFGWPCYEGGDTGSARRRGFDNTNLDLCETLYAQGDQAVEAPYYAYNHANQVVGGETCPSGSSSISGLAFYAGGPFPDSYDGALFFADYSRDCIWVMYPGANGLPDKNTIATFDPGAANPVDLEIGPQGDLFYPDLDGGTIRRIVFTSGNAPPQAVASADPANGPAPLTTQLSASGSSDSDGDELTYAWDLDGDGFDDGNQQTFTHQYTSPGTYTAVVKVTDPDGASDTDSVEVQAGNSPPSAQITAPAPSLTWAAGDTVAFSGTGTDPQQATLPATAFDWRVIVNHCPSTCHQHVMEEVADTTSGSFTAPDHEYPSTLTVELTVTDSGGLTDTDSVEIDPRTVQLTLDSLPAGLEVSLDDTTQEAPLSATVIENSQHTVIAPPTVTLAGGTYSFSSWSDGGAATHNVKVDASQTLTAGYYLPGGLLTGIGELRSCGGLAATKIGTPGDDVLVGTAGPDVLMGLDGRDRLIGVQAKDVLCGGAGRDVLKGRAANDRLLGGSGADLLFGGKGVDVCAGNRGPDREVGCEKVTRP